MLVEETLQQKVYKFNPFSSRDVASEKQEKARIINDNL